MYVYYIVIKIYVFIYINIFSPFYCLYITNISQHSFTIDFTYTNNVKPFKIKISIPFTIIFYEILYSYNNLILSSENVFKDHKHPFIYYPKGN